MILFKRKNANITDVYIIIKASWYPENVTKVDTAKATLPFTLVKGCHFAIFCKLLGN